MMNTKELNAKLAKLTGLSFSGKTRTESDLIGEREIPNE